MGKDYQASVSCVNATLVCSDGIHLAAQRWRRADEQTHTMRILALHGFLDNLKTFSRLAPSIVEEVPAEFVAIDLPGHGRSSHRPLRCQPNGYIDFVFYVLEALRNLKWDDQTRPIVLIGHSMGSAISIMIAAAFPKLIGRLILLDGVGPEYLNPNSEPATVQRHISRRLAGQATLRETRVGASGAVRIENLSPRVYPNLSAAVEARQQTATNSPGNQTISIEAAKELTTWATLPLEGGKVMFGHDPRLLWPTAKNYSKEHVEAFYCKIRAETLCLRAEDGWPFPQEEFDCLSRMIGKERCEVICLPGSHHYNADPATGPTVAEATLAFLKEGIRR